MNTSNAETGPLPLPANEIEKNKRYFRVSEVANDGRFNEFGIFHLGRASEFASGLGFRDDGRLVYGPGIPYWNQRLLGLSPEEYRLRLKKDPTVMLQLIDQERQRVARRLSIKELRRIDDINSGIMVVGESGYLINPRNYRDIQREDQILAGADQGKRPIYFDNSPFVKLFEPNLAGQNVLYLNLSFFDYKDGKTKLVDDGVVIDMENKMLLGRRIEYPLAYAKWGEIFGPGNFGRIESERFATNYLK